MEARRDLASRSLSASTATSTPILLRYLKQSATVFAGAEDPDLHGGIHRRPVFWFEQHPDGVGCLRGQLMELQGRQQADHPFGWIRHASARLEAAPDGASLSL